MGDFSAAGRLGDNHDSTISKEKEEHLQPITTAGELETETILSNVRAFVSQQQYFFDVLHIQTVNAGQTIRIRRKTQ